MVIVKLNFKKREWLNDNYILKVNAKFFKIC